MLDRPKRVLLHYLGIIHEEDVMAALESDPLGVVVHYALSKLHEIITTLNAGTSGVTVAAVFYVGKEGRKR